MKFIKNLINFFKSSTTENKTKDIAINKNVCGYCGWCEEEALDERKFCQRHEDLVKFGF